MTGMETWHIVAPIIAAHSVKTCDTNGKYVLNPLDEAYVMVYVALKQYDEKEKEAYGNKLLRGKKQTVD